MNSQPRSVSHMIVAAILVCTFSWLLTMAVGDTRVYAQSEAVDLTVIQSDQQAIVLELAVSTYTLESQIIDGIAYHPIQIEGLEQALSSTHPQVPSYGTMVGLPTSEGVTVDVIDAIYTELVGYVLPAAPEFSVAPTGMDDQVTGTLVEQFVHDPAWRTDDQLLPAKVVDMKQPGYLRGQSVAQIQFYPVQYNPARQLVRIYQRIRVRITWPTTIQPAASIIDQVDSAANAMLAGTLINYPQLAAQAQAPMVTAPVAASAIDALGQQSPQATGDRLARIVVSEDGFYEIGYDALLTAGVSQSVLAQIPVAQLAIENQGMSIRSTLTDADQNDRFTSGDTIHFYGVKLRKEFPGEPRTCPSYSEARPNHWYAEENVYWLLNRAEASRITQIDGAVTLTGAAAAEAYPLTRHFEEDESYWQAMPDHECNDRWFWKRRLSATPSITLGITTTHAYPLTFGNLPDAQARPTPILTLNLRGYTGATHPFTIAYRKADSAVVPIRDQEIRDPQWSDRLAASLQITVPYAALRHMKDLIITARPIGNTAPKEPINQFLLNWIEVELAESYRAVEPTTFLFGKSIMGDELIELQGLAAADLAIYDITNPAEPEQIINLERLPTGTIRFQSRRSDAKRVTCQGNQYLGRCYLAVTAPAYRNDAKISAYQAPASRLASRDRIADYVIITAEPFRAAATKLADHRRAASGLRPAVVTVSQIYDEFNGGIPNPRAIRDFLGYAYHCWNGMGAQKRLAYVVLMGDASQDYKDHLGVGQNYVPSFSFESSLFGEVSSDNWFASFVTNVDDIIGTQEAVTGDKVARMVQWCDNPQPITAHRNGLPNLFIGRIPVADQSKAEGYIEKIINYEKKITFTAAWARNIYFVADDEPKFETTVTALRRSIGRFYNAEVMTIPDGTPDGPIGGQSPDAKALEIVENLHQGQLLVSYIGHGDYDAWGRWDAGADETPYIFHKAYLDRLANGELLPLVTVGNCLNGFFAGPTRNTSFAEAFLFDPDGGAIAVWAPTGFGLPSGHRVLLGSFYETLFLNNDFDSEYDPRRLGVAAQHAAIVTYTKNNYWQELVWTYILFGDPALKMPIPTRMYLPIIAAR